MYPVIEDQYALDYEFLLMWRPTDQYVSLNRIDNLLSDGMHYNKSCTYYNKQTGKIDYINDIDTITTISMEEHDVIKNIDKCLMALCNCRISDLFTNLKQ